MRNRSPSRFRLCCSSRCGRPSCRADVQPRWRYPPGRATLQTQRLPTKAHDAPTTKVTNGRRDNATKTKTHAHHQERAAQMQDCVSTTTIYARVKHSLAPRKRLAEAPTNVPAAGRLTATGTPPACRTSEPIVCSSPVPRTDDVSTTVSMAFQTERARTANVNTLTMC